MTAAYFAYFCSHPAEATILVQNAFAIAEALHADQRASFSMPLGYVEGWGFRGDPLSVQMPDFMDAKAAGTDNRLDWHAEGEGDTTVLVGSIDDRECAQIYVDAVSKCLVLQFV